MTLTEGADGEGAGGDGTGSDSAEALSIVRELRKLILEILDRLTDAVKYGRRTRFMAWALVVSAGLDVALSVAAGFVLAAEARQQAAIHAAQVHACQIGNGFRAGQLRLWDHVIAVSSAPPGETAAERRKRLATITGFRAYIGREFRPVDCGRLYRR